MTDFKKLEENEELGNLYYIPIFGWNGFITSTTVRSKMEKPTYKKLYNELRKKSEVTKNNLLPYKIMQAIRKDT